MTRIDSEPEGNEVRRLPWEPHASESLIPLRPSGIVAWPNLVVLSRPRPSESPARIYLAKISAQLPGPVRAAIDASAGAFDFPTNGDVDLDDLIGD